MRDFTAGRELDLEVGGAPVVMVRESESPEALAMDDQLVDWLTR